mmetsp:Transcript_17934/g.20082  ORF Transcript_17934/g.20082 Transcript_17934/m.20082 type:complete len:80 (-) Transcript_17934:90-329(-)
MSRRKCPDSKFDDIVALNSYQVVFLSIYQLSVLDTHTLTLSLSLSLLKPIEPVLCCMIEYSCLVSSRLVSLFRYKAESC